MADTPDIAQCADLSPGRDDLLNPFFALNYHFGMLLGVDDFATEQQYHHGKMRLHNAWLHRAGVVWGFDVRLDTESGEIRVLPGLALDGAGHELHLDGEACVNVVEWFLKHKDDPDFVVNATESGVVFDAHVEIRFKSCLTRQVPALLEPCEGGSSGTAYSRLFETVDIQLVPNQAAEPGPPPYHRLRVLFQLIDPVLPHDQDVVDARTAIQALSAEQQPAAYLQALRRFAALDEIDLKPATASDDGARLLFPQPGDSPVLLANITGIALDRTGAGGALRLSGGTVDVTVRPSHVATATIQELLCGPLFQSVGPALAPPHASSGPRVIRSSVQIAGTSISFEADQDLHPKSLTPGAFSVSTFSDAAGWAHYTCAPSTGKRLSEVTLKLKKALPAKALVRIIARGRGPKPILGADLAPLGGATDDPTPTPPDGRDFVFMQPDRS